MKRFVLPLVFAFGVIPSLAQEQKLNGSFIKEDTFDYNGYVIRRTFEKWRESPLGDSRTVITQSDKQLIKVSGCCFKESTRTALLPLLGKSSKQLLIEVYSGGGHCCTSYYIYDLDPFRKIFGGDHYSSEDVGYEMRLIDINKDGVYEFIQSVMNFDYFYSAHAGSVFPEVVFAYDTRAARYRPANREFNSYLLRDIDAKKRAVNKFNGDAQSLSRIIGGRGSEKTLDDVRLRTDYFHAVADVVLTYIYAGQREEGWTFFNQNYRLRDKEELRRDIHNELRGSQIYKSIYQRTVR